MGHTASGFCATLDSRSSSVSCIWMSRPCSSSEERPNFKKLRFAISKRNGFVER